MDSGKGPHGRDNGVNGHRGRRCPPRWGTRSVARSSEALLASLSRQRDKSTGYELSAPRLDSDLRVDPLAPAEAYSPMPASSPEPDDTITTPLPSAPQKDFRAHQDLLKRVASSLQLQAEEMEGLSDSLFNVLSPSVSGCVALPLHQGVANFSNALWLTLAPLAPISRKAERKYFVPAKNHEYLYSHLAPNSLVVESVNHREWKGQPAATPQE
ncbi:hypothetical protein UY3_09965 [Chelonia mydas]|uniref:Uncharacterized protein n=1 Tax=Chelonia mydas TaxID=8469 RepID=M7B4Q2_CHEMY|nr:hypothetical protein UY3_09965 [Chelonia mydas]